MSHAIARLLPYLRRLTRPADADAVLLERFAREQDQAAFAALVGRHGPMVVHVCRRVLGDEDAAEDAFQAVFLVLARRAASLGGFTSLAGWLYGVAQRVAFKARSSRLRARPQSLGEVPEPAADIGDPLAALNARELVVIVEEEIRRLPESCRLPVVLCCLEGFTLEEAARRLGCTDGSLRGRLERGRNRLRARLTKRGVTLSVTLAAVEAGRQAATATLPTLLTARTTQAALQYVTISPPAGVLSTSAVALSEGVLHTMWLRKLCWILILSLALAGTGSVAGVMLTQGTADQAREERPQPEARSKAPAEPPAEKAQPPAVEAANSWTKKLGSGVTVELVGISKHPITPDNWWKPDGAPAKSPFKNSSVDAPAGRHEFVIHLGNLPADPIGYRCEISGSKGGLGTSYDGSLLAVATELPTEQRTCTVRVGIAAGPWKTAARSPGSASIGGPKLSVIFSTPRPIKDGTAITVSHTLIKDDIRLVAIDFDSKTHSPRQLGRADADGRIAQLDAEFAVPRDRIREFQFLTCPLEWAEFKNVFLSLRTAKDDAQPAAGAADATAADWAALQGAWKAVKIEINGKEDETDQFRLIFKDKQIQFERKGRIDRTMMGTIRPTQSPKEIDFVQPERSMPGIYELQGSRLRICFAERGTERPTAFVTQRGTNTVLLVLEKE